MRRARIQFACSPPSHRLFESAVRAAADWRSCRCCRKSYRWRGAGNHFAFIIVARVLWPAVETIGALLALELRSSIIVVRYGLEARHAVCSDPVQICRRYCQPASGPCALCRLSAQVANHAFSAIRLKVVVLLCPGNSDSPDVSSSRSSMEDTCTSVCQTQQSAPCASRRARRSHGVVSFVLRRSFWRYLLKTLNAQHV